MERFVTWGDVWQRFESVTRKLKAQGEDRSVADVLESRRSLSAADRRLLASIVEGYDAAPIERASEQALSTAGEEPSTPDERAQYRILSGYDGVVRALEARARRLLAGVHRHDWTADSFSRGAYSCQAVGGASAPERLARSVETTLFFAGEATSSDQSGTVPGAIESGRRGARLALR